MHEELLACPQDRQKGGGQACMHENQVQVLIKTVCNRFSSPKDVTDLEGIVQMMKIKRDMQPN